MSHQQVSLRVSDALYQRIQQAAESSNRSLEAVLQDSLNLLFGEPEADDFDKKMADMPDYSDEQLWAVVHSRMPLNQALRLRELNALSREGKLTAPEKVELDHLLDIVDRYMLLRSEALLQLKQRGHDVSAYLKSGS